MLPHLADLVELLFVNDWLGKLDILSVSTIYVKVTSVPSVIRMMSGGNKQYCIHTRCYQIFIVSL